MDHLDDLEVYMRLY